MAEKKRRGRQLGFRSDAGHSAGVCSLGRSIFLEDAVDLLCQLPTGVALKEAEEGVVVIVVAAFHEFANKGLPILRQRKAF